VGDETLKGRHFKVRDRRRELASVVGKPSAINELNNAQAIGGTEFLLGSNRAAVDLGVSCRSIEVDYYFELLFGANLP
jgi:hypothetical protein